MNIKKAREVLGKRSEKMSDEQMQKLIDHLVVLCNIVIDTVVNKRKHT